MGNRSALWTVKAADGQHARKYPTELGTHRQQKPNNIIETVPSGGQRQVVGQSAAIGPQVWLQVISQARKEAGWVHADTEAGTLDGDLSEVARVMTFTVTTPAGVQVRRDHSPLAALMGPIAEPPGGTFEVRDVFRPGDGSAAWLNIESPRYGDAWVCLGCRRRNQRHPAGRGIAAARAAGT